MIFTHKIYFLIYLINYWLTLTDILKIQHLKKYYIKKKIFSSKSAIVKATDDVSFSIKKGEVFVLAGESGSGKSTIAKLILKSIQADSGKIIFEDQEIDNQKKNLEIWFRLKDISSAKDFSILVAWGLK